MSTVNHIFPVAGAAALVLAMCTITQPANQLSAAAPAPAQANPAVAVDNDFAVDLYRQLAKEKPAKNLFFSPYSMLSALTMTAEGRGAKRPCRWAKRSASPRTPATTAAKPTQFLGTWPLSTPAWPR